MPQSLSQVIIHVVFSTKDRYRWLDDTIASRMHAYLATICRDCSSEAYRVGGMPDHVHLAVRLGHHILHRLPLVALNDLVDGGDSELLGDDLVSLKGSPSIN